MITVTIPTADLERQTNEATQSILIVNRLKEAGVPVIGAIFVRGVERGSLRMYPSPFGDLVCEWADDLHHEPSDADDLFGGA